MEELTCLLLAARDGDRVALAAAVRASQAEVWRVVRALVGTADADDVTQDTFVRAWRALPAYRGDASGRTWLLSIARRAAVDALRRRGRARRLAEVLGTRRDAPMPDPAGAHTVEELVRTLAPERREAFVLTQLAGCSYAEAATICAVPVGTIRSRVARAREDLARAFRKADTG